MAVDKDPSLRGTSEQRALPYIKNPLTKVQRLRDRYGNNIPRSILGSPFPPSHNSLTDVQTKFRDHLDDMDVIAEMEEQRLLVPQYEAAEKERQRKLAELEEQAIEQVTNHLTRHLE